MPNFLLDIEGTTTPISFVHQILFPYSRDRMAEFLANQTLDVLEFTQIKQEFEKDVFLADPEFLKAFPNTISITRNDLPAYLCYLIDRDRKFGPLKRIQGEIWKKGYEAGEIKSQLFEDVPEFLKKAKESKISCYVYSSGSVEAQKLIYQYSTFGDLREYFQGYFDTAMGGKRERQSYQNIAHQIEADPETFIFFTDIVEEAEAASLAGMRAVVLDRPGNTVQKAHSFTVKKDLKTIDDLNF